MYDHGNEAPPDHPWFRIKESEIEMKIEVALQDLQKSIPVISQVDEEMRRFEEAVEQAKKRAPRKRITVVFYGPAGVGKTSTINSLLNRIRLFMTSGNGRSGSLYPVRITYLDGAKDGVTESDIEVQLIDDHTFQEDIEQSISDYGYFRYSMEPTDNDASYEDYHSRMTTALDIFSRICATEGNQDARQRLEQYLEEAKVVDGSLSRFLQHQAHLRKEEAGQKGNDSIYIRKVSDENLKGLQQKFDRIWPLVKCMVIKTGGLILENGVDILDTSGELKHDAFMCLIS